jgi:hypothetical protein
MDSEKSPKVAKIFKCDICDYKSSKKSDFIKHLATEKHQHRLNDSKTREMIVKKSPKISNICNYQCKCGKIYKYDSGYYRHKKQCTEHNIIETNKNNEEIFASGTEPTLAVDKDELIKYLMKENSEFKQLILDQNKLVVKMCEKSSSSISNSNINSNNKTFNLNFFLNEQCKDAINMSDFIDSIVVSLTDLENTGRLGFVEGLSKLFIKHLEKLDTYKRPIHCSDLKREVLYIKDENKWEKDTEEKEKLQKAIKDVGFKNIKQIAEWVKKYPDCRESDSRKNDQYIKITMNAMSGGTKEEQEKNINKIIANIAKEVVIDK